MSSCDFYFFMCSSSKKCMFLFPITFRSGITVKPVFRTMCKRFYNNHQALMEHNNDYSAVVMSSKSCNNHRRHNETFCNTIEYFDMRIAEKNTLIDKEMI